MTQTEKHAVTPTEAVARQVRAARQRLGWSAQQLADQCAKVGDSRLDRSAIANIESGRRQRIGVDELLVLGYALAVPPLLLLVPLGDEDEYAIVPTVTVHPHLAWKVIVGDGPPVDSERVRTRLADWHPATLPIRLHHDLQAATRAVEQTHTELRFAELEKDEARLVRARTPYVQALKRLARVLDALVEAGLRPPLLHPDVRADLLQTGAVKYPEVLRDRPLTEWEKDDDGER